MNKRNIFNTVVFNTLTKSVSGSNIAIFYEFHASFSRVEIFSVMNHFSIGDSFVKSAL